MKFPYPLLMLFSSCLGFSEVKNRPADSSKVTATSSSIYSIPLTTIDGEPFDLSVLKGKKILIVNTASECGFTPQYKALQKLHEEQGSKVTILGFPCNDFGGQEPGAEQEIAAFCEKNYGVTFQLFEKTVIKGDSIHPLYKWLTDPSLNGWNREAPSWNFCKYVINEKGELINYFGSGVSPTGPEMLDAINQ